MFLNAELTSIVLYILKHVLKGNKKIIKKERFLPDCFFAELADFLFCQKTSRKIVVTWSQSRTLDKLLDYTSGLLGYCLVQD